MNAPGIGGLGDGIDMGASYRLMDNLTLSAALLNLGWIRGNNALIGEDYNEPYIFEGFQNMGSDNDIEDQLESLGDDMEALFRFKNAGNRNRLTMLSPTLNVGAEYELPAYRELSFGLLSSTTFRSEYTYTELRGVVAISPLSWFDAAVSGALTNYGASWGMLLNFPARAVNFFVASGFIPGEVHPQFVPVNKFNMNFNFVLYFAFVNNK